MYTKLTNKIILVIAISVVVMACGQSDTKTDAKTDSGSAAPADTVKAATVGDAVTVAPNLYKVLADSIGIRILEATYNPGDSSALHSHNDYAIYVIEGGTAEFSGKDGTKTVNEMKTGVENIRPYEIHGVKNIGKTVTKVLLVETTRPKGASTADATLDATKVAANHYKLIMDSLGFRIIESSYKPGESSIMHAHPDLAMYVIAGGKMEFTGKDGKKMVHDTKSGMAAVVPADTHSVKNVGKETVKVLLVEVNRPAK